MKIQFNDRTMAKQALAFTFIEVVVSTAIFGLMVISLYAGFSSGWYAVNMARENVRSTQIMIEKFETIRLYTWSQINSNGFVPTTFTSSYFPGAAKESDRGLTYTGKVTIARCPLTTSYSDTLRLVTIDLSWVSKNITHNRQLQSYVSKYGLQNYVY